MHVSYFPVSDALLALWCKNYREQIVLNATELGMTPDEVSKEVEICDKIITKIDAIETKKAQLNSAFKSKELTVKNEGGKLRKAIANHKTVSGYTQAIGEDLGVIGSSNEFNPNEYKAEIFVKLYGGNIRIRFLKRGVDGINLYKRAKGQTQWVLVSRVTKSPLLYHPVLAQPNVPEHIEFRAYGVINDLEIGIPSDINEILFGE